jgi:PAS domain S-box-containing protein
MESNSRDVEKEASFIIALGESAMVIDRAGVIIDANARQAEMLGLTAEEMRGASIWKILPHDAAGQERLLVEEVISSGRPVSFMDKFGERWLESSIHPILDAEGRVEKLAVFRTDITNRRRTGAEKEAYREELEKTVERRTRRLRDLNRALQTTSDCNQILFRAEDEMELLSSICRAIVDVQGARMAWVGYFEDGGRTVRPVAQAGIEEGYIELARIIQESGNEGEPTQTAMRTKRPCVVDDIRKDSGPVIWRREARRRGFASTVSIPLLAGDEVMGVLSIFSDDAGAFDDDRVRLLAGLADDLSFGIRTLRARAEHHQAEERVRAALREKEVLLKEVHHRVKNNLQVIISLLSIQSRQVRDRAVLDVLRDSENRIRSIALIHEKLYKSEDVALVDFAGYVQNLVPELFKAYALEKATPALELEVEDIRLGIDVAVPCGLIINELVTNCLKHAFPSGRTGTISIEFQNIGDGGIVLQVSDDGVGLPEGLDIQRTNTMGLGMVKALTEQLEGTFEMVVHNGTAIRVCFSNRPEEE